MQIVYAPATLLEPSVFLGGSITGAWDWQDYFIREMRKKYEKDTTFNLTIFNPRRNDFDVNDKNVEKEQIEWEFRQLRMADAIVFWFSHETLAPITLFELGRHSVIAGKDLFIGVHPEYKRKSDVIHQMKLVQSPLPIYQSVDELIQGVYSWAYYKNEKYHIPNPV